MNDRLHDWNAALDADIAAQPGEVLLTCGSDLKPQAVRWLWQYWLALGKFHILAGAPGQGKTTIAMAVAATITIGGRWPDGGRCEPGNILVWSGEDDPADTLLPRLLAAGANPKRCFFITGTRVNGESVPFDPARDLGQLEAVIQKIGGIRLLIVDPVVSAVTGDSHKNTEVRRALQPLVDLAARCDCAVLGITHFSKGGQGTDPAQRVLGSVAFSAVARVVLVAARVKSSEEGEENRILARGKSNIGPDNGGFEYRLEQTEPIPGIEASRIAWGRAVEGTARELLTDPDEQHQDETGDAVDLLRGELDPVRWTSSDTACEPLKTAGFSKKQIWQASKKLGVIRRKDGMKGGWLWSLPKGPSEDSSEDSAEDSTEDSEDSSYGNGEPSESSGALESSQREVI
jgi:putative DNA primase/helicase